MTTALFDRFKQVGTDHSNSVQTIRDAVVNGYTQNFSGSGATNSDVQTAGSGIATTATNSDAANDSTTIQVSTLTAKPIWMIHTDMNADVSTPVGAIATGTSNAPVGIATNTLYFSPITASQDQTYVSVKFACFTDPYDPLLVGVYTINPLTGLATLVADCGDARSYIKGGGDGGFSNVSELELVTVPLPAAITVNSGDILAVGFIHLNSVFPLLYNAGGGGALLEAAYVFPTMFLGGSVSGSVSSLPATIADVNTSGAITPWAALGYETATARAKAVYYDGFTTVMANSWTLRSGSWTLQGGIPSGYLNNYPGVLYPTNGNSALSTYSTPMPSDDMCVILPVSSNGAGSGVHTEALVLRCNPATPIFAFARILYDTGLSNQWQVAIKTHTSFSLGINLSSGTSRASATLGAGGGAFKFGAVGNVYTLYRGNRTNINDPAWTSVLSWTDSGGVVPIGSSNRTWGFAQSSDNLTDWLIAGEL